METITIMDEMLFQWQTEFLTVVRHITEVATRRIILLFAIYFPSLFSPMSSIRDTYLDREINPLSKSLRALML